MPDASADSRLFTGDKFAGGRSIELEPAERVLDELQRRLAIAPAKSQRVAVQVLRRQLKRGRTAASKKIRETVPLSKKLIDRRISVKVVSERSIFGWLRIRAQRFELVDYMTPGQIAAQWQRQQKAKTREFRTKGRKVTPIKVRVWKGAAPKVFDNHFVNIGTSSRRWHVMRKRFPEDKTSHEMQFGPPILARWGGLDKFATVQAEDFQRELLRVLQAKVPL